MLIVNVLKKISSKNQYDFMVLLNKLIMIMVIIIILYLLFRYIDFINQKSFKTTSEWWYLNAHITADDGTNYGIYIWQPREDFLLFSISDELNEKYYFAEVSEYELQFDLDKVNLSLGPNYWIQSKNNSFNFNIHIEHNQTFMDFYLENKKKPLGLPENKSEICYNDFRPSKINEQFLYCYLPRTSIQGNLTINSNFKRIKGISWIEHARVEREKYREWFGEEYCGQEWFNVHLDNEMDFWVVKELLSNNKTSYGGAIIDEMGNTLEKIYSTSKILITGDPQVGWHIIFPEGEMDLNIQPTFKDQIFDNSFWEMSCKVNGTFKGMPVTGLSYAEIHECLHLG